MGEISQAGGPPRGRWAWSNQLKATVDDKGGGTENFLSAGAGTVAPEMVDWR